MAVVAPEPGLVPLFKKDVILNEAKTQEEGRPIFDEREVVEIRFSGDRSRVSVFPAHDPVPGMQHDDGEPITYAERFGDQYRAFKNQDTQVMSGTPLSEAPFLTQAQRSEMRALNIYTVEQLSDLEGRGLKTLGMDGRKLKDQATAYLQAAKNSADPTAQAARIVELEAELARRDDNAKQHHADAHAADRETQDEQTHDPMPAAASHDDGIDIDDATDEQLKAYIKKETGEHVRGNPNRETLVKKAREAATRSNG